MEHPAGIRRAQFWVLFLLLFLLFVGKGIAEELFVAQVNGVGIPAHELEEAIDQLIPRAVFHGNVSAETRSEFRDKALDDLIVRELRHQDARARGLKPDKQAVKQAMEKVRDRYPSKADYRKALAQSGYTEEALKARFERDSLVKAVITAVVTGPARVGDAELKEYYDRNPGAFTKPETARLRIISARDEKKAKEALALVKAGEDFGMVAARMSEDSYRIKGGDIGFIHQGRIYPPLEEAAFRMKPGEVSGLLFAEGSWFIVKVEEKQPGRQIPYEEAKAKLKQDLEKKRTTDLTEKWMAALREKATIEIVPSRAAGQKQAQ